MSPVNKISTESGIVLFVEKRVWEDSIEVIIKAEDIKEPFILHWGLRKEPDGPWYVPPERNWPSGSHPFDHAALRNLLEPGAGQIVITIDRDTGFSLMDFVLFFPGDGSWDNNLGRNYRVELPAPEKRPKTGGKPETGPSEAGPAEGGGPTEGPKPAGAGTAGTEAIEAEIAAMETGRNSWTLMHRYNLCFDLLDRIGQNDTGGLALIYVWLRFSALRQLDWQRNYNTKPGELGHALDRLSAKLTGRYREAPGEREMIRLIMTTLGRGSDAQRVRDEVLNIMHRHGIKEVSGHFMEEWHQKLHNNATPDDIIICEAYLDFLKSDGNLEIFYKRLSQGGVSKERLESYDRPIKSHPDFSADLKGPLIHDFENFLSILKEVHSGTDLDAAAAGAGRLLDDETKGLIEAIRAARPSLSGGRSAPALPLAKKIIEARRLLTDRTLSGAKAEDTRDLLFLDMALEDSLRAAVERATGDVPDERKFNAAGLVELFSLAFENVWLSLCEEELQLCFGFWRRLEAEKVTRFKKKPWALRAEADLERTGRAIGDYASRMHSLLQPAAKRMGAAFHAEPWSVRLFAEEALRGRPVFALSALLRRIDPLLRKSAAMGNWLIISRGAATDGQPSAGGQVKLAASLKELQGQDFSKTKNPVVLVADRISGDEDIPAGVSAIITPSTIDRLSHLAIRARNAGVFFAACLEPDIIGQIKSMEGRSLRLDATAAGEVLFSEEDKTKKRIAGVKKGAAGKKQEAPSGVTDRKSKIIPGGQPGWSGWAIPADGFTERTVGYKSINLKRLIEKKLPAWINIPRSAAIPFGVFEKVLGLEENSRAEKAYRGLEEKLAGSSGERETPALDFKETLAGLRNIIAGLKAPAALIAPLMEVMDGAGLPAPSDWDAAWACIKRVWASKWNDRAYLNRRTNGIDGGGLFMSVLIQEVVSSDLSFVIHTANPITGDTKDIYAEAVLGLGESLAGNYPGMPLGFAFRKGAKAARIFSMPGKSCGFFVFAPASGGLIFRSDSNGEDLAGYAGAGLYDSFILPKPEKVALDYSDTPLVWDEKFLKEFTSMVARTGAAVQDAAGGPQDIEGAYCGGKFYVVQARPQVL